MKGIFNNGMSETIDSNDIATYTTNVEKFDRTMLDNMERDREVYDNLPVPSTSRTNVRQKPVSTKKLQGALKSIKSKANKKLNQLKKHEKQLLAIEKREKNRKIKGGLSKERANMDYRNAKESVKNKTKRVASEIKGEANQEAKNIRQTVLNRNKEYISQINSKLRLNIQELERRIYEINDLVQSGKIDPSGAKHIKQKLKQQRERNIEQLRNLNSNLYKGTIKEYEKIGLISPGTANKLLRQKSKRLKEELKNYKSNNSFKAPKVTYNPVDKETGRQIARDVINQMLNDNPDNKKLKAIYENMRHPKAESKVQVEIQVPDKFKAQSSAMGEKVYQAPSKSAKRISVASHKPDIPVRSIASNEPSEDVSSKVNAGNSSVLPSLYKATNQLQNKFRQLYSKLERTGENTDVQLQLSINSIEDTEKELNEAKQTSNYNSEFMENKLKQLGQEYKKAINDIKRLI